MAEEIIAVCPHCGQQYTLPAEYVGGEAECENCHQTFVIQAAEASSEAVEGAEESAVAPVAAEPSASAEAVAGEKKDGTSTVKLQRVPGNVGMVPDVDDEFHLEVAKTSAGKRPIGAATAAGSGGRRSISSPVPKKKPWWKIF